MKELIKYTINQVINEEKKIWSLDDILNIAQNYPSFLEMNKKNNNVVRQADKLGMLDELKQFFIKRKNVNIHSIKDFAEFVKKDVESKNTNWYVNYEIKDNPESVFFYLGLKKNISSGVDYTNLTNEFFNSATDSQYTFSHGPDNDWLRKRNNDPEFRKFVELSEKVYGSWYDLWEEFNGKTSPTLESLVNQKYSNIPFSEIKKLNIEQLISIKQEYIDSVKSAWVQYIECVNDILKEIDADLLLDVNSYDVKLDEWKPFFENDKVINFKGIIYVDYDLINSNSDVRWNSIYNEYYSPNPSTHKRMNSCYNKIINKIQRAESERKTYPKSQITFEIKYKPSENFSIKQNESDLYRQYRKYISNSKPYPGDENVSQFIDDLIRIKGSKPDSESSGERLVRLFLEKHNVKYKQYHRIKKCFSVLRGKCYTLPFDFYLPKTNVLIEYDGEQHYKPVSIWGGEEGFKRQKMLDGIKDDFCRNNNIKLVRIPYTVKNEKKLIEYLTSDILGTE
jgi:hypothetical protein